MSPLLNRRFDILIINKLGNDINPLNILRINAGLRCMQIAQRGFKVSSNNQLAKILASDSIEKVCGKMFADRGHTLVEKPGIKKDELIKIIGEYEGLVVRSGTKV
jgi:hypothetical protein